MFEKLALRLAKKAMHLDDVKIEDIIKTILPQSVDLTANIKGETGTRKFDLVITMTDGPDQGVGGQWIAILVRPKKEQAK